MIDALEITNYKAFEKAKIPIKPITIFLGANSVGKSSIIQLLLLLQQTGKEDIKSYTSALKLYGGYVNLGDSINLFRKLDTTKPLKLKFKLQSNTLKQFLQRQLFMEYINYVTQIPRYVPIKSFLDLRHKSVDSKDDFEKYIDALISVMKKERTSSSDYIAEIEWFLSNRRDSSIMNIDDLTDSRKGIILKTYSFLDKLSKRIKGDEFTLDLNISYQRKKLNVSKYSLSHNGDVIISFEKDNISSSFISFEEGEMKDLAKSFSASNTIFNIFSQKTKIKVSTLTSAFLHIINCSLKQLKIEFTEDKINYVSPLRAHPKRYYMLDKAKINLTLDTLDGDAIAEVLKENSALKGKVNKWLNDFGLSVNVEEFKEVVHHLKVKQNDLNLDITDVGFGISQVLPVIIQGFLSAPNSTTIIEQPEIHLHPKMQADLADLFIDIINSGKAKKLIVETHSEYLLKRLRRRISEGVVNADDISICLFNPQSEHKSAYIENVKIEEKGYFDWPIDFYGGELLRDTTEFLINQGKE